MPTGKSPEFSPFKSVVGDAAHSLADHALDAAGSKLKEKLEPHTRASTRKKIRDAQKESGRPYKKGGEKAGLPKKDARAERGAAKTKVKDRVDARVKKNNRRIDRGVGFLKDIKTLEPDKIASSVFENVLEFPSHLAKGLSLFLFLEGCNQPLIGAERDRQAQTTRRAQAAKSEFSGLLPDEKAMEAEELRRAEEMIKQAKREKASSAPPANAAARAGVKKPAKPADSSPKQESSGGDLPKESGEKESFLYPEEGQAGKNAAKQAVREEKKGPAKLSEEERGGIESLLQSSKMPMGDGDEFPDKVLGAIHHSPEAQEALKQIGNLDSKDISGFRGFSEDDLQNLSYGFGFLKQLGKEANLPILGKIGQAGDAFVTINKGLNLIVAATGPLAALGGVGLIAGAALVLFSMWGDDSAPDPMFEYLKGISDQVEKLHKDMLKGFSEISHQISQGFKQLSRQMAEGFGRVITLIHELSHEVILRLDLQYKEIKLSGTHLHVLGERLESNINFLARQPSFETISFIQDLWRGAIDLSDLHRRDYLTNFIQKIKSLAKDVAHRDGATGGHIPKLGKIDESLYWDRVDVFLQKQWGGMQAQLGTPEFDGEMLTFFRHYHLDLLERRHKKAEAAALSASIPARLANPEIWSVAAEAYAKCRILATTKFGEDPYHADLNEIKQDGEAIINYAERLATDSGLYEDFIADIFADCLDIGNRMRAISDLVSLHTRNKKPDSVRNELLKDTSCEVLRKRMLVKLELLKTLLCFVGIADKEMLDTVALAITLCRQEFVIEKARRLPGYITTWESYDNLFLWIYPFCKLHMNIFTRLDLNVARGSKVFSPSLCFALSGMRWLSKLELVQQLKALSPDELNAHFDLTSDLESETVSASAPDFKNKPEFTPALTQTPARHEQGSLLGWALLKQLGIDQADFVGLMLKSAKKKAVKAKLLLSFPIIFEQGLLSKDDFMRDCLQLHAINCSYMEYLFSTEEKKARIKMGDWRYEGPNFLDYIRELFSNHIAAVGADGVDFESMLYNVFYWRLRERFSTFSESKLKDGDFSFKRAVERNIFLHKLLEPATFRKYIKACVDKDVLPNYQVVVYYATLKSIPMVVWGANGRALISSLDDECIEKEAFPEGTIHLLVDAQLERLYFLSVGCQPALSVRQKAECQPALPGPAAAQPVDPRMGSVYKLANRCTLWSRFVSSEHGKGAESGRLGHIFGKPEEKEDPFGLGDVDLNIDFDFDLGEYNYQLGPESLEGVDLGSFPDVNVPVSLGPW